MGLKNPYYVEGAFEPHDDGELPDLEPLDALWDPVELSTALNRMVAACDQLLSLAYRTPRR